LAWLVSAVAAKGAKTALTNILTTGRVTLRVVLVQHRKRSDTGHYRILHRYYAFFQRRIVARIHTGAVDTLFAPGAAALLVAFAKALVVWVDVILQVTQIVVGVFIAQGDANSR